MFFYLAGQMVVDTEDSPVETAETGPIEPILSFQRTDPSLLQVPSF